MEQFKRAQVVMLPTEFTNPPYIPIIDLVNDKHLSINNNFGISKSIFYHLYIISDNEIKNGDWCYSLILKKIYQYNHNIEDKEYTKDNCKKIIATTDTSLTIKHTCNCFATTYEGCSECLERLPQPSQQFIERYIESYNAGEVITDILVEYETKCIGCGAYPAKNMIYCTYPTGEHNRTLNNFIKVNPKDNTITIRRIKDSWNREELIILFKKHEQDVIKYINNSRITATPSFNDKWIKENL